MIGILYESDEWSDWKLGRELEAACAKVAGATAGAVAVMTPSAPFVSDSKCSAKTESSESAESGECGTSGGLPGAFSMRFVRMINVEDPDCVKQACQCELLVSRVFASAPFRGHLRAHGAMERIIAMADEQGIPLINPGRAHRFETDKRLATGTLRSAGIDAPAIVACGTPEQLLGKVGVEHVDWAYASATFRDGAGNCEDEIASDGQTAFDVCDGIKRVPKPENMSGETVESWPYPCVIKPNCGGRTTHTAVLHDPAQAREFLESAPAMEFIVEPFVESRGGFLTRLELVDGKLALAVKRSVAASGLSSYHEGSTYELYPDCPRPVVDAVLAAGRLLGIEFGSFDVIESDEGNVIIDANSVSNVSEDCTELFGGFDLMAAYAQVIAARWHETALR